VGSGEPDEVNDLMKWITDALDYIRKTDCGCNNIASSSLVQNDMVIAQNMTAHHKSCMKYELIRRGEEIKQQYAT
jgi:hypothetical protein